MPTEETGTSKGSVMVAIDWLMRAAIVAVPVMYGLFSSQLDQKFEAIQKDMSRALVTIETQQKILNEFSQFIAQGERFTKKDEAALRLWVENHVNREVDGKFDALEDRLDAIALDLKALQYRTGNGTGTLDHKPK